MSIGDVQGVGKDGDMTQYISKETGEAVVINEDLHMIALVVGDDSHDGHGLTDKIFIFSSLTFKELKEAYKEAVKIIGFDFSRKVCNDSEENMIKKKYRDKLAEFGITFKEEQYMEENELTPHIFAQLWLEIVRLAKPDMVSIAFRPSELDIGGYGVFIF